jgi:hypothetical protein
MNKSITRIIMCILLFLVSTVFVEAGCNKIKYCPNCKFELKPEFNNCPNCGYNLCSIGLDSINLINKNDSLLELKSDCINSIKNLRKFRNIGIGMAIVGPAIIGGLLIGYFNSSLENRSDESYEEYAFFAGLLTCASIPMIAIPIRRIKLNRNILKSINIGLSVNKPGISMNAIF